MWSAVLGFSNEADRKYSFYLQLTIFTTPFFRWPGKKKKKAFKYQSELCNMFTCLALFCFPLKLN